MGEVGQMRSKDVLPGKQKVSPATVNRKFL